MAIQDDLAKADKSKSAKKKYMSVQESLAGANKSKSAKKSTSSGAMYATNKTGVNSSAPKKSAVDKSGYNKNIKVSQAQIDAVKKLGMAGAMKGASAMSPAMREAATRLYGAKRIGTASASKPAFGSGNSSNYGMGAGKPAMAKKGAPKTGPGKPAYSTGSTMSNKRTANPSKPSIGEQITGAFTGNSGNPKNKVGSKPTSTSPKVKQESARDRLLRETMAKKKK